jgi:hypothetical protein
MSSQLQRLVVEFQESEFVVRTLYRRTDGPNPGMKARAREVQELTRTGLQDAWRPSRCCRVCRYFRLRDKGGHHQRRRGTGEGSIVNVALSEMVEAEVDRLIEKRSADGEVDPDEREELWKESIRRYNARRREEMRAAWCEHHQGQAARLRTVLEELIARHEGEAAKLMNVQPEGAEELGAHKPQEQRWREAGEGGGS